MTPAGGEAEDGTGEAVARLDRQVGFLLAADGLKEVLRHNRLHGGDRRENAAEHSWHLALMAMVLSEHAPPGTDTAHVAELLVVHDLVEVYAGDHWVVETNARRVASKERAAAERSFGTLPPDQRDRFAALWMEYETRRTPEARFARALDALHPMLLTWGPGAAGVVHTPLTAAFMREHKRAALEPYPSPRDIAQRLLDAAVTRGLLPP